MSYTLEYILGITIFLTFLLAVIPHTYAQGGNGTVGHSAFSDLAPYSILIIVIIGLITLISAPLLLDLFYSYRISRNSQGINIPPKITPGLYRTLVAIGVIFVTLVIVVFLIALITLNIANLASPLLTGLVDIFKNFTTIIGTAFASLVAFYFGTKTDAALGFGIRRNGRDGKPIEITDINPIDGSVGEEVNTVVTSTFSIPIRSSTITVDTFSIKDPSGNPVQGKIRLVDNNSTIKFEPIPAFNHKTTYTVTITKGITDLSGITMTSHKEWHFTTVE